ncbi:hypothetical protein ACQPZX_15660 [Actinoplanes sp. CA-142083]|uniref:hypothetical protein n=1 Tax=Actinoplanes sp. CA-142083 TaxID=3239903 RepID=UPI003D94F69E
MQQPLQRRAAGRLAEAPVEGAAADVGGGGQAVDVELRVGQVAAAQQLEDLAADRRAARQPQPGTMIISASSSDPSEQGAVIMMPAVVSIGASCSPATRTSNRLSMPNTRGATATSSIGASAPTITPTTVMA